MSPDKILIFIPCYNCAPQIGRVVGQLTDRAARIADEILIVDNGSRDGTAEAAISAIRHVDGPVARVFRNRQNYNLGGSHKAAFAYADRNGFSHVIVLHGDDQGNIADILPLLQAGEHRTHDACLGARFMRGSRLEGYSRFRIFGNHVFNILFTMVSGRRVHDLGSGLNVFGRAVFTDPDVVRYADDLRFNIFMLLDLFGKKRRLKFFPISWREDDQISNVKMVSQAWRTLAIGWEYVARRDRFRSADHRDIPRSSYEFDLLGRSPEAI